MEIKGYKEVTYQELQSVLHKKNADANMHEINMAASVNVKSVGTIRNVFNTEEQTASDEVLTKVFNVLNLPAFVLWFNGQRKYYLSNKN